jgi:hypothetical protein
MTSKDYMAALKPMTLFLYLSTHINIHSEIGYVQCCGKRMTMRNVFRPKQHVERANLFQSDDGNVEKTIERFGRGIERVFS